MKFLNSMTFQVFHDLYEPCELAEKQANKDGNLMSMEVSMFKLVFKLELFWMNNKTIMFGFG